MEPKKLIITDLSVCSSYPGPLPQGFFLNEVNHIFIPKDSKYSVMLYFGSCHSFLVTILTESKRGNKEEIQ